MKNDYKFMTLGGCCYPFTETEAGELSQLTIEDVV